MTLVRPLSTIIAVSFFCFVAAVGTAQSAKSNCTNTTIQPELNACAEADYEAADDLLNRTYKDVMARLPDERSKQKLKAEERVWISHRDKRCNEKVGPSPGIGASMWPMEMANCLEEKTAQRIRELRKD
jgi:uncharacterized protein YecT (DUF1311 family)